MENLNYFEKYFYRGKMKNGKFLKNVLEFGKVENSGKKWENGKSLKKWKILEKYARIWGKWKNLVKTGKNRKTW